jgi:hypothetical protein
MESDPLAKSLKRLERVKGIEPSYSAWKSAAFQGFQAYFRQNALNRPIGFKNEFFLVGSKIASRLLDGVADALRKIIGTAADAGLRMAA